MAIARIRTIREAFEMIKKVDPDSSLAYFTFRQIVLSGAIPHFKCGNRYLLNFDDVEMYFESGSVINDFKSNQIHDSTLAGGIREISI